MTIRIGAKSFPDTLPEILKDNDFRAAFGEYLKKQVAFENLQFYVAVERGVKPDSLYKHFISDKARKTLNIPYTMRKPMNDLAAQHDFSPGAWRGHLKEVQGAVYQLMGLNFYLSFFQSDAYLKLMESKVIPSIKAVPKNLLTTTKLKDNTTLVKDKDLLTCVRNTKMHSVLQKKKHPTAGRVKAAASKQLAGLTVKHKFTMKYDAWVKFVHMSM